VTREHVARAKVGALTAVAVVVGLAAGTDRGRTAGRVVGLQPGRLGRSDGVLEDA
jgi:hypothetical protein